MAAVDRNGNLVPAPASMESNLVGQSQLRCQQKKRISFLPIAVKVQARFCTHFAENRKRSEKVFHVFVGNKPAEKTDLQQTSLRERSRFTDFGRQIWKDHDSSPVSNCP